jgi:hypothetical protein
MWRGEQPSKPKSKKGARFSNDPRFGREKFRNAQAGSRVALVQEQTERRFTLRFGLAQPACVAEKIVQTTRCDIRGVVPFLFGSAEFG